MKLVTGRPAVVLSNGDYTGGGGFGRAGCEAVAALVDGGADAVGYSLCSQLSITDCFLGNRGAMAIAKACYRTGLKTLCLDSCGVGNAGAVVLALALGRAATGRNRTPGNDVVQHDNDFVHTLRQDQLCFTPSNNVLRRTRYIKV